jgi:hypothetical protein
MVTWAVCFAICRLGLGDLESGAGLLPRSPENTIDEARVADENAPSSKDHPDWR